MELADISKHIFTKNEAYDSKMAIVVGAILLAILCWIPVLGPATAGYVCGRKTGSMMYSILSAIIAGAIIFGLVWVLALLFLTGAGYPGISVDMAADSMTGIKAVIADYIQLYFVSGTTDLNLMIWGVMIAFAAVGGILSRQVRLEMAYILSEGSSKDPIRPSARSIDLHRKNKKLGFECFNDYVSIQGVMVNEAVESKSDDGEFIVNAKKPTVSTTDTVSTTVVSGGTENSSEASSPFADILQRTERRVNRK